MSRGWWAKLVLLVFLVGLSAVYVFPTLARLNLEKTKFPFKQKINPGLDLQGIHEIERAKDLIGRTAKLEFRIADDKDMEPAALSTLVADIEKEKGIAYKEGQKFSEYVAKINEGAKGKLPPNTEIAFERS